MTGPNEYKEVRFDKYCKLCKYLKDPVWGICNECLEEPINLHSEKPVKFEEKEK